jgi:ethanolamine transporter
VTFTGPFAGGCAAGVIGVVVITVVMACAVAGALASLVDRERGLGKEFLDGLHAIGYIFVPVAGIMAAVPYLSRFVPDVFGPVFAAVGADPAMAATTFIAVDMGGYHLARDIAKSNHEVWILAMLTGYMAGATIVFSVPVGLSMLDKKDHPYMALGVMSGLLSVPVGVLVAGLLLVGLQPAIRTAVATNTPTDHTLRLTAPVVLANVAPLAAVMGLFAFGLRVAPGKMVRGFMAFGRGMNAALTLVLVASIVQYFTQTFYGRGVFTALFGHWGFAPIIADGADQVRALEVAGYIGTMLSGAFPMVYLMKKYLTRPMAVAGRWLGLEAAGAAGLLAAVANILAMFRLVGDMRAKDKVLCIAFAVCAAFLFGDHLAFTANFQPNLLLPVMAGKLSGGLFALLLAHRLSVPRALELERQAMVEEARAVAAHVPALRGRVVTVTPLGGGLTNRNYRVEADGEAYVLRIAGAGTGLLGIDREREVSCSHAAAGAGAGPEVVAYLPDHHALVTAFVRGKTLTAEEVRRPELLRRLAATLRRCHDYPAPPDLGTFSPFTAARSYLALARSKHVPLPARLDAALGLVARVERELHTDDPPCLCHNDLLPGNLIDDGAGLRIIDWEYGGLGDRFFDLGNLAVNSQLDDAGERALLAAYRGGAAADADLRRLRLMRLASDFREAAWGYLQAGVSTLHPAAYYLDYGGRHLDRLLAGARTLGLDPA